MLPHSKHKKNYLLTKNLLENILMFFNNVANTVGHAILGAVVAELQGNSGLAGGAGAVGGELEAKVIIDNIYGGRDIKDLTEAEKQNISVFNSYKVKETL
ncbi:hypothetical protein [Gilliamella sp. Pas-s95]|uniref:hypothetical protein n=1 Tax=Gilliamella sp. Pas-s95 TaxID=2687317 RepID=UPI00132A4F2A|nr:hypothetical protein [Gilliamella sp. Pas-s95]MWN05656.1 hypothetical protein [Gilliamella sp. Pas-s95]